MKPIQSLFAAAAALVLFSGAPAAAKDRDNSLPGRAGGAGTNWENPPGGHGGPGASPDRMYRNKGTRYTFAPHHHGYYYNAHFGYWHPLYGFWNQKSRCWFDNDNNPPGPVGGRGTNWENPQGSRGGPGASPNRYRSCR
ncbi:hypothetical protein [Aquidulcibacter sp.]|uniref:hypothetical protein n=1 Tax=Aquidulcibacter sp. TaxID=2052990 RepID=UPI0028A58B63|nr:hypothetical protein [Aquidulcibacter sp.]